MQREMVANIKAEIKKYIVENNLKSLVLGISGGVDSALVAALASTVCNEVGIPLIGRSITIETNSKEEVRRSHLVGSSFCNDFKEVNLTGLYIFMKETYEDLELQADEGIDRKIREGNLKARIRMTYLYDIAKANKGIVLSTDNLTEYYLGFWTLMGDVGDYGPIQQLWKTEVYEMTRYLCTTQDYENNMSALMACIDAVPTDGLGITTSDLEQIGASSYDEVDDRLMAYIKTGTEVEDCPIIARHLKSQFKREWPIIIPRDKILTE